MTLKHKVLALYVAATLAILATVGGFLLARFRHDRLEDLEQELLNQLKHIDFALTGFMTEADNDVAALAANELVRTRQDAEFTSFLQADPETWVYHIGPTEQRIIDLFSTYRLTHPYVNSVYMGRENGSFVRSHPRAEPTQYDPRLRPWYVLARDNPGQIMHTAPYRSVTTADVNIGVVTALVDDQGLVYGVVGADITLASLTHYLSGFEVGHEGQILLLDSSGTVLAGKDKAPVFQSIAPVVGDRLAALLSTPQGTLRINVDSEPGYLFFYTSPYLGWKIAIAVPASQIQREIMSVVLPGLAGLLLALALLSGLTFAGLNRAVIRPIVDLQDITLDVARTGDLHRKAEVLARDEIGVLAASFNVMLLNIREVQDDLRRERDLAEALKDTATAAAAENARLYEQVKRDALELEARVALATQELALLYQKSEQHAVELGILYEIGKEITATPALDAMLETIVDSAIRLVDADRSLLALIDVPGARLVDIVGRGYSQAQLEEHTFDEFQAGLSGWVLEHKTATLSADLQHDERQRGAALASAWQSGDRSAAVAPLLQGDQVLGTLTVVNGAARPAFTPADLNLVNMLADQAAVAIQKAQLYEAAQEADRLKSAFLASMSHELRTPLNSIIGFTGILLQGLVGPLNGEQQKQLGMVMHSARHLLALINDVLDISRIEAGALQLVAEPFDVCQAIQHAVQTVTPLADKKGLALVSDVSPTVGRILGDQRRLEQVLINLINNAIKFTDRGEIRVRSEVVDGRLITRVTDTGIGIRPQDVGKLFQPFWQVETGVARRHEGTGLGLAICDRLVSLMGGRIDVTSRWGEGSTFTLTLPAGEGYEQNSRHRGQ